MNYYKRAIFALLFLFISIASAQEQLSFSRQEAETIFLKQNLSLIAKKLEIPKAQAAVLQAKLWPNPTLSISEVNLWATDRQKEVSGEELPPLFGKYGKHQQFGIGIEQLIQTAGKRKKLIALELVSAEERQQLFTKTNVCLMYTFAFKKNILTINKKLERYLFLRLVAIKFL